MSEDIRLEGGGGDGRNLHGRQSQESASWQAWRIRSQQRPKTPVFGMVERGGRVIAKVTPDTKAKTLYPDHPEP